MSKKTYSTYYGSKIKALNILCIIFAFVAILIGIFFIIAAGNTDNSIEEIGGIDYLDDYLQNSSDVSQDLQKLKTAYGDNTFDIRQMIVTYKDLVVSAFYIIGFIFLLFNLAIGILSILNIVWCDNVFQYSRLKVFSIINIILSIFCINFFVLVFSFVTLILAIKEIKFPDCNFKCNRGCI